MSLVSPDALSLPVAAEAITADLCAVTGAYWCVLHLHHESTDSSTVFMAASVVAPAPWDEDEGAFILQQVVSSGRLQTLVFRGHPAVALPLQFGYRLFGAILLGFTSGTSLDIPRLVAASQLAARTANASRQVELLHQQAEQMVEGMRLREIQNSRNLIRGVIDSVPIGLALIEMNGSIRAVNRALADRFGNEPARLVGQFYGDSIGLWDDSPAAKTFASGQPQRIRRTVTGTSRSQDLLEIASFPIADGLGQPYQVVEVWEDITERVSLQTQLVRAEKLAAIGQLAASIAHEVGNPLQAIQGFLALFLEQCPPNTPNQSFLTLAEEEIDRIVHVLARLRDLYRPRADIVAATNLNELVDSVLLLTSKQLERSRIRIRKELSISLPFVDMVADQIKQVVLNLVLNAADAMSGGGILHIQTYLQHERNGTRSAVLTITDTGVGIPADQLPYIFDGLHTTKERGMGLGLYTSRAIVERHVGRIKVQSKLGDGTTFIISLPVKETEISV
jgi:PAS domain S-box-containing protein